MNQLKLYRQAMVSKQVAGLSKDMIVFSTGEWWALAIPFEGDRLEYIGRQIKSVRVIDGCLELIVDKQHKVYLHWKDENGITTGPRFPVPGKIRCWERSNEDLYWEHVDQFLKLSERILAGDDIGESEFEALK